MFRSTSCGSFLDLCRVLSKYLTFRPYISQSRLSVTSWDEKLLFKVRRNCLESSALLHQGSVSGYTHYPFFSLPDTKNWPASMASSFSKQAQLLLTWVVLRWTPKDNILCVRAEGSIKLNTVHLRWGSPPCRFQLRCWSGLFWEKWNL